MPQPKTAQRSRVQPSTAETHASTQHCRQPCLSPALQTLQKPQTWHSLTQPHLMLCLQERDEHLCQRMGLLITSCRDSGGSSQVYWLGNARMRSAVLACSRKVPLMPALSASLDVT